METLTKANLVKYIEHAIFFESSEEGEQRIISSYRNQIEKQKPTYAKLPNPVMPTLKKVEKFDPWGFLIGIIILSGLFVGSIFLFRIGGPDALENFGDYLLLVLALILPVSFGAAIIGLIVSAIKGKIKAQEAKISNQKLMEEYNIKVKDVEQKNHHTMIVGATKRKWTTMMNKRRTLKILEVFDSRKHILVLTG